MAVNYDIPLHDIKPLLEVQEYSFEYLLVLIALGSLLFIGAAFLLYKYLQNRNKFNIRKEHLHLIKQVEFSDAKKASYDITFYGHTFKDDSERHTKAYEQLLHALEPYKYKKEVDSLDSETLHFIEIYLDMLDV